MSLTAFGQASSSDSVLISRDQQRKCIVLYHENVLKDSIIHSKDSIISIQDTFIELSDELLEEMNQDLSESRQDLNKMKKKRNRAFIVGGFSVILSTFLTFILS